MNFNTAISALMELTNAAFAKGLNKRQKEMVAVILAPLAPHLAEEVWESLGHGESIFTKSWPKADPKFLVKDVITYGIQVNGKLRGTVDLSKDVEKEKALAAARAVVAKYMTDEAKKRSSWQGKLLGLWFN